jgi:hypothetical protein
MRPTYAWLAVVALAACSAPVAHWDKSGADQATTNADTQQCREQARLAQPPPMLSRSPDFSATPVMSIETREDRDGREAQQFQMCMQEKGYVSVRR